MHLFILIVLMVLFQIIFEPKVFIKWPSNMAGTTFILLGILLNFWADLVLRRNKTTVKPYERPSKLITAGPFRFSRNPIYLGLLLIILGVFIILGSLITIIFPIVFIILMDVLFIRKEEKMLEKRFGKKYLEYKQRVRRWI